MKKTLWAALCFSACAAQAQHKLGVATSNYAALDALYQNPALLAGTPQKLSVQLFDFNFTADNSFATIRGNTLISSVMDGKDVESDQIFKINGQNNFNLLAPCMEIRLPGVVYRINNKNTVGLHTRVRVFNQMTNFDRAIYESLTDQSSGNDGENFSLQTEPFNWTIHAWGEIGLSYAREIFSATPHRLKAGISLRYLKGIAYTNLRSQGVDVDYDAATDITHLENTSLFLSSNLSEAEGMDDGMNTNFLSDFFSSGGGTGLGADIGFVYEFRPHRKNAKHVYDRQLKQNGYLFRVSMAVTDIGSIQYKKTQKAHITGSGDLKGEEAEEVELNYPALKDYFAKRGFDLDSSSGRTKVSLPTALRLNIDYNIWKSFYVQLAYIGNIGNKLKEGNTYFSQLTVVPRFDIPIVSVGIPVTYNFVSKNVKAGFGVRVSGFEFGSDDLLAIVGNSGSGINFYMGFCVPVNRLSKEAK